MRNTNILLILAVLFLSSCVEEFWPELEAKDDKLLVVEGFINNEPGPYTVKLSTSRSMDSIPNTTSSQYDFDAFENAVVTILDDQGNSEVLTEVEPGIYKTSASGIQGVVGRSYKISIVAESGKTYESNFDEIQTPIGIESIEYNNFYREEEDQHGLLFNVNTVDLEGVKHIKWEVEETYEYHSPHNPTHVFEGYFSNGYIDFNGNLVQGSMTYSYPYNLNTLDYSIDHMLTCWQTNLITTNYISTNEYSNASKISDFPLHFVPHQDVRIRVKYSILVYQHVLSKNTYRFIRQVDEQNSHDEDDLYTKQPYLIRGNVSNINDEDEPVLGMFFTKGTSKLRIFTPPDSQPLGDNAYAIEYCRNIPTITYNPETGAIQDEITSFLKDVAPTKYNLWPIYFGTAVVYDPLKQDPNDYDDYFVGFTHSCIDCRLRGGENTKPSYWED